RGASFGRLTDVGRTTERYAGFASCQEGTERHSQRRWGELEPPATIDGSASRAALPRSRISGDPFVTSPSVDPDDVAPSVRDLDTIVSLSKRRGFIYPSSEIYGGINAVWDYGPLGEI